MSTKRVSVPTLCNSVRSSHGPECWHRKPQLPDCPADGAQIGLGEEGILLFRMTKQTLLNSPDWKGCPLANQSGFSFLCENAYKTFHTLAWLHLSSHFLLPACLHLSFMLFSLSMSFSLFLFLPSSLTNSVSCLIFFAASVCFSIFPFLFLSKRLCLFLCQFLSALLCALTLALPRALSLSPSRFCLVCESFFLCFMLSILLYLCLSTCMSVPLPASFFVSTSLSHLHLSLFFLSEIDSSHCSRQDSKMFTSSAYSICSLANRQTNS